MRSFVFCSLSLATSQDQLLGGDFYRDPGPAKHQPWALWPSDGRPGLWMHTCSKLGALVSAAAAAAERERAPMGGVPPVFGGCAAVLAPSDERACRDLYWQAVASGCGGPGGSAPALAARQELEEAHLRNPWCAEPLALLAQLKLDRGEFAGAQADAEASLALLAGWGTAWDKRVGWEAWVAWTRVLAQRAAQREPWPKEAWAVINLGLVR